MRLLIAPDKFKGSLSALEAASALGEGWRAGWPSDWPLEVRLMPVADGGEGTAAVMNQALGGCIVRCAAHDALLRPISAGYVVAERLGETLAVIDMSEACGLQRIDAVHRAPLTSSTFGTGEMVHHAIVDSGADVVIVGLGGSATNDGGLGLAMALGYRFVDQGGCDVSLGSLGSLARIIAPVLPLWSDSAKIIVASDVRSPLLGDTGATAWYGPQKGLTRVEDREALEEALAHFANVVAATVGVDHRHTPGAGAAGGLGFGLLSLCAAEIRPGFEVVAAAIGLEDAVAWADLVLTGEGCLDGQTLQGKAPFGVAALARRHGKRVVAFAGQVDPSAVGELRPVFDDIVELSSAGCDISVSMHQAAALLRAASARVAALHC